MITLLSRPGEIVGNYAMVELISNVSMGMIEFKKIREKVISFRGKVELITIMGIKSRMAI